MSIISIKDQFYFQFNLGGLEGFIDHNDLIDFTITEASGNILPVFRIVFETTQEDILGKLTETNILSASFGRDKGNLISCRLVPVDVASTRAGQKKRKVSATGFLSRTGYLKNRQIRSYPIAGEGVKKKSGVEVIHDVISKFNEFVPDFNVEKSDDLQLWIQPNHTDRFFITDVWMRCYFKNGGFPIIGISADNSFIFREMLTYLKTEPKWDITQFPKKDTDILFTDAAPNVSSGLINDWTGYGSVLIENSLDNNETQEVGASPKPVFALTEGVDQRASISRRWGDQVFINENVHSKYWYAYNHNLTNLVNLSRVKLIVTTHDYFYPIKVLDLVNFYEDTSDPEKTGSERYHSGRYIVGSVTKQLTGKRFAMTIELFRESLHSVSGHTKTPKEEEHEDIGVVGDETNEKGLMGGADVS